MHVGIIANEGAVRELRTSLTGELRQSKLRRQTETRSLRQSKLGRSHENHEVEEKYRSEKKEFV